MGDVVSSHLDEAKRDLISARTSEVMRVFGVAFEQQYAVALFNSVRFEIEGGGGAHQQLLHRKDPLSGCSIFSGSLFQYLEENRKWRSRYVSVPNSYVLKLYENKTASERGLHPKASISCGGYKALSSVDEYMELVGASLPGVKAKAGGGPFIKCSTPFPLILWHPFARHHYFCVLTEKEHRKWLAVLKDCVRHSNHGLPEDSSVETPAFTDAVRLVRQAQGHHGTWDMMCGAPPQILANLVMENLHPELRKTIGPRLKGKLQQRQKNWMLISDAVYRQVLSQTKKQYEVLLEACQAQKPRLDARLRTDMDQIVSSKEHICSKMRALVLPRAEEVLRNDVQPYIGSILEALMEPTSRGFSEVREVFFGELVELSKNLLNGGREKLGEQMERLSMLAFHPVKMLSCYQQVEQLSLEGLQQRFQVSSPSAFISRAQILMREQMDNAVFTFEQLLQQSLAGEEEEEEEDACKKVQRCQDRVLKKYDYDSSTVRKKFFREALLQIIIPHMLQQLSPSCSSELPRFKELIFEDFSRFLLVENMFEEVVLQSVSKDIAMAVKEAAVQRRHNLYRDSMVLSNSDPSLNLLDGAPVDWAAKFGAEDAGGSSSSSSGGGRGLARGRKQVVSMIQLDGVPLPFESCLEVPGVELIPEEDGEEPQEVPEEELGPKSPDSVHQIRGLINPVVEVVLPNQEDARNGTEKVAGTLTLVDGGQEEVTSITTLVEDVRAVVEEPAAQVEDVTTKEEDVTTKVEDVTTKVEDVSMKVEEPTAQVEDVSVMEDIAAEVEDVNTVMENVTTKVEDISIIEDITANVEDANMEVEVPTAEVEEPTVKMEDISVMEDIAAKVENVTTKMEDVNVMEDISGEVEEVTATVENITQVEDLPRKEKVSPQSLLQQLVGKKAKATQEVEAVGQEVELRGVRSDSAPDGGGGGEAELR